jgi:CPA2 family monovalent cation:H+ antiporter-2
VPHDVALIETIAAGFCYALVGGFVAARIGLPPLLGYLAAGVLVGPFTPCFVADSELAAQLAEIGVILLMFGVGMHVSLRDLLAEWRLVLPGASAQILIASLLGLLLGRWFGWGLGAGLVFGLCLSIASTVVLLRALETMGLLASRAGRIAVAWLVVEDLLTVLALVVLPTLAGPLGGGTAEADPAATWRALLSALGRITFFMAVIFGVGTKVLPAVLEQVVRTGSRELFTLAVLAAALVIAFVSAEVFHLSFALGAFFAGVVVRESDHSHRAETESRPFQDTFVVMFFVSVGMLFDPAMVTAEPWAMLAAFAVIVVSKPLVSYAVLRLAGAPLAVAALVGAGLGQIGEFSFVLAALGRELGVLTSAAEQAVLGGALASIVLSPFLLRLARLVPGVAVTPAPAPPAHP